MGLLHNLPGWHALIILAVVLLLFGAANVSRDRAKRQPIDEDR